MYNTNDIEEEARQYQQFLEQPATDNPDEMANRLGELNNVLARTGMLLAEAKAIRDAKQAALFRDEFPRIKSLSPTVAKTYIEARCMEENRLVNWLERLNRACVHIGDNMRTLISLAKENLRLIKTGI